MKHASTVVHRARQWLLGAVLLLSAFAVMAKPANVIISVPTGTNTPAELSPLLSAWRQSGQVSDVLWLDSTQKDGQGIATLVALEFASEGSYQAWQTEESAKLPKGLSVVRADVLAHGEITPRDSNKSIFVVKAYDTLVPAAQYASYVKDYIVPNMENQRASKVLIRYTMYLPRVAEGQKSRSLLVTEYRDSVAHARSEGIKDAYKKQLIASNPTWKRLNDTKETIRTDAWETLADYQELPPPQLPNLPSYKPEFNVVGSLRIVGSELKNAVDQLAAEFKKFHPQAKPATSHIPSSEGGIAALYFDVADVAPMGDDAKITDMMPFYNTFGYMPTEISVATGGYEKRGSLWAWAIVVSKDNPLEEISVEELKNLFGAARSGGWERVENDYR